MGLGPTVEGLELHDLAPEPGSEWRHLLEFVGLSRDDRLAMSRTVETLMRYAPDMVIDTYDYLESVPETAAILGWEHGVDQSHLEERRRFFTIWIARVLGMDTSEEFATYLFRAGKFHAGHGPRNIHVPSAYITTAIGLMSAAFVRCMSEARLPGEVMGPAMVGWSKYLSVQLHLMHRGYEVARALEQGDFFVTCTLYGRLRSIAGWRRLEIAAGEGDTLETVLRKLFNYAPQLRAEALRPIWQSEEKDDASWVKVYQSYVPAPGGWRFLLNGRNVHFNGGFENNVACGDVVSLFPPGR